MHKQNQSWLVCHVQSIAFLCLKKKKHLLWLIWIITAGQSQHRFPNTDEAWSGYFLKIFVCNYREHEHSGKMCSTDGILYSESRNSYHNGSVVASSSSLIPVLSRDPTLQLWMALWHYMRLFGLLCPFLREADCIRTTFPWFSSGGTSLPPSEVGDHEQWHLQGSLPVDNASWCY